AFRPQVMRDLVAEVHARVVGRDADPHDNDSTPMSASSSSALLIAPSRRTVIGSVEQSTTVDGLPTGVGPPSRMIEMRPSRCPRTSCAVVESPSPERFALVTGSPPPPAALSRRAT